MKKGKTTNIIGTAVRGLTKVWYSRNISQQLWSTIPCVNHCDWSWAAVIYFSGVCYTFRAKTGRWTNVSLLLGHRLRCWPNIKPTLANVPRVPGYVWVYGVIHDMYMSVCAQLTCQTRPHYLHPQCVNKRFFWGFTTCQQGALLTLRRLTEIASLWGLVVLTAPSGVTMWPHTWQSASFSLELNTKNSTIVRDQEVTP